MGLGGEGKVDFIKSVSGSDKENGCNPGLIDSARMVFPFALTLLIGEGVVGLMIRSLHLVAESSTPAISTE